MSVLEALFADSASWSSGVEGGDSAERVEWVEFRDDTAGRQNAFGIGGLVLLSETHLRASGSSGWDRRTTVCSTTGTRTPVR